MFKKDGASGIRGLRKGFGVGGPEGEDPNYFVWVLAVVVTVVAAGAVAALIIF